MSQTIKDVNQEEHIILVVDDEPDIVNLTQKFLELEGYKTIACNNGKEALKILESEFNNISLILLDLMMPGISGVEVLREIRSNEMYNDILIVAFTVKSFNEDIQKVRSLGADGYITKPFAGKDLLKYVKKLLKEKGKL